MNTRRSLFKMPGVSSGACNPRDASSGCRSPRPCPGPARRTPRPRMCSRAADTETVGRHGANRTVLPVNQVVTPLGVQVELPGLRPQALALSPDGGILITAGKTRGARGGGPVHRHRPPARAAPEDEGRAPGRRRRTSSSPTRKGSSATPGLRFSPDGRRAFLSDVNGSVVVFDVAADGTIRVARSIRLPAANAPRRKEEIPAGLAVSPDGTRLYVCGNLSNTLLEVDVAGGRVLRTFDVGVAPYDVVLTGGKAYVSNWGGRRPLPGERTGPAGRGTEVKVDPVKHVASEGSVTVIDLQSGKAHGRDRDRAPRERARRVAGRPPRRLRERRQRHPQRDRHADGRRGRDDLGEAEPGRPLRRPAQRARLRPLRPERSTSRTARRTPWPSSRSTRPGASRSCRASSRWAGSPAPSSSTPRAGRCTSPTSRATPRPRSPTRRKAPSRRRGLQLAPLSRLALPRAGARGPRAPRPERDGVAQPPPRAHRRGAPAAAARPARPRRARADRRAEPHPARRLRHQGEPHLRPGAGRRRGGQRGPTAVHLRRADDPQPAQAGARVRAARQHLLRRHPERRRPPVEHHRHRHRLPGALLRRLAAQLSRRHGRGRGRRPRLLPRGLPLGQRAPPRHSHPQLRRVHGARGEVARPLEGRARRTSSPATAPGRARATRRSSRAPR